MTSTLSKVIVRRSGPPWIVETWMTSPDKGEYCQAVHEEPSRRKAEAYAKERFILLAPPEVYQGEGI
jgi:hypothetical protein